MYLFQKVLTISLLHQPTEDDVSQGLSTARFLDFCYGAEEVHATTKLIHKLIFQRFIKHLSPLHSFEHQVYEVEGLIVSIFHVFSEHFILLHDILDDVTMFKSFSELVSFVSYIHLNNLPFIVVDTLMQLFNLVLRDFGMD